MQFRVQGFRFKKIFRGGAKLTELLVLIYEKQRKMLAPQNVQNFHSKLILSISKHFRHRNSKIQWVYQYKCSKWRTKEVMNCCCFVEHTQSLARSVNHRCTIPKQETKNVCTSSCMQFMNCNNPYSWNRIDWKVSDYGQVFRAIPMQQTSKSFNNNNNDFITQIQRLLSVFLVLQTFQRISISSNSLKLHS